MSHDQHWALSSIGGPTVMGDYHALGLQLAAVNDMIDGVLLVIGAMLTLASFESAQ